MLVIEVELLSGRYHAHTWGEAQFAMAGPEWPPSPWRLLRALASAWFSARPHPSSEQDRDALLEALGGAGPPELWLPRTSLHEIRYYQPIRTGGADRVLHHDFFAVPEGGRFWFCFKADLNDKQRCLLRKLLGSLRYFGRCESRARLRWVDLTDPPPGVQRVGPRDHSARTGDVGYCRVLCPGDDFRAADLWAVRTKAAPAAAGGYPPHLVDTVLRMKMPIPDGTRWVQYATPRTLLVEEIRPQPRTSTGEKPIEVAEIRFRLNRRIPIPLGILVPLARAFRDQVVARHWRLTGMNSPVLSGRDADGNIARGHWHAYYLPGLSDTGLSIETLRVRIPGGWLTRSEFDALFAVTHIGVDGSPYPVSIAPEEVVRGSIEAKPSRRWVSVTPFLPPLYRHRRDGSGVEERTARFAKIACGLSPVVRQIRAPGGLSQVTSLLGHDYLGDGSSNGRRRWVFARRLGFWLELVFEEAVVLPAALGADAHFGAGQFKPLEI